MELDTSTPSKSEKCSSRDDNELRRGPWTLEEDDILIKLIANHGEGRWNLLAMSSGLRRTGKSCRLRWLNYLKPDIKRGNLTSEEQLLIFELHSKWGNRWSKIAQHLPGRTDNEIKNYWKTKIQKERKHLKINTNETRFLEIVEPLRMIECLEKSKESSSTSTPLPFDGVSHHSANEESPNYLDQYEKDSYTMHNNDLWLSSNFSNMTQPLGYTTSQFQALDNNEIDICANDDFHISDNAFEMDCLNLTTISDCQISESNWLDEEFACNIWNMN